LEAGAAHATLGNQHTKEGIFLRPITHSLYTRTATIRVMHPASRAGIDVGDLIVSVNGRIVLGTDDLHRILSTLPSENAFLLGLVRDGRLIEVSVEPKSAE
ncbi:MAG: PDZ domain-containing protein, partial [Planctomycetaceae bacterium]|nr:PDZ domain-containing protein [Planctomycetaceae bacterium]